MKIKQVVSSRWTFFLKLALPMLWTTIFGSLTLLFLFFLDLSNVQDPFSPASARILMASFFLSGLGLFYLLFLHIKWVAVDETHIYISNFYKSYKYTFDSIAKVEETKVFLSNRVTVHFHKEGAFGQQIFFLSSHYWHYFLKKHPHVLEIIMENTKATEKQTTEE